MCTVRKGFKMKKQGIKCLLKRGFKRLSFFAALKIRELVVLFFWCHEQVIRFVLFGKFVKTSRELYQWKVWAGVPSTKLINFVSPGGFFSSFQCDWACQIWDFSVTLCLLSFFLSKINATNFFVKLQHSLLDFCHLTNFF